MCLHCGSVLWDKNEVLVQVMVLILRVSVCVSGGTGFSWYLVLFVDAIAGVWFYFYMQGLVQFCASICGLKVQVFGLCLCVLSVAFWFCFVPWFWLVFHLV